jgi:signal transduction histidine kinase
LVALATTSLIVLAFFVPLSRLVADQAESRALAAAERDAEAVATAIAVAGAVGDEQTGIAGLAGIALAAAGADDVSVFLPDDGVIGAEAGLSPNVARARSGASITARIEGGVEVLVPVVTGDGTLVVRAFTPDAELTQGVASARLILAALGLFLIVVAVVVGDRMARSVVGPAGRLAAAAHGLGEGDLDVRVRPEGPDELAEVGEAFNVLATRLEALLVAERESVADLSHRLRTPLTALRLQAERLTGPDGEAMQADIERLSREVDRLIEEARRPVREDGTDQTADLAVLAAKRFGFWEVLARDENRLAEFTRPGEPIVVRCRPAELGDALDALLGNVFSHTPRGVGFRVAVDEVDGFGRFRIEDDGPGLSDPERVLGRGKSEGGSTGLGLDIARRLTERTGGHLVIRRSNSGGALIEALFGPPAQGAGRNPLL